MPTAVHSTAVCVVSSGGASGRGWKPAGLRVSVPTPREAVLLLL